MTYGGSTIYQHNYLCNLPLLPIFHTDWILVQLCNVRLKMMSSFIILHTRDAFREFLWKLRGSTSKISTSKQTNKQTNKQKSSPHQKKQSAIAITFVDFQICQTDFPKLIPFLRLLEAAGDMISPTQPKHWGEIPSKHTWVPPIFFPYRSRHFWVDDLPFPKLGYDFFSQESNLQ